jgi:uncharacterized protein (DUF2236 family)
VNAARLPLFSDDSLIRRVHRENVVLLGGGRALLLQVAHPAVAAAVAEHSAFRRRRLDRLLRTLKPTLAIVFGTPDQVRVAAGSVNAVHAAISAPGYRAADPALLFWVLATLIDTALLMHALFLGPLDERAAQSYYEEMLAAGSLLGVEVEKAPVDVAAFRVYMAASIESLRVTEAAREIVRDLFSGPLILRPLLGGLKGLTAGLLPETLRAGFGLDWGPRRQRVLVLTAAVSRLVLPRIPRSLRSPPRFLLPAPAVKP